MNRVKWGSVVTYPNSGNQLEFRIESTVEDVAVAAVDLILAAEKRAIADHGIFKFVLSGGTTPENVYRLLVDCSCDWSRWQFYLGDERCLPENHKERNSQMLKRTLFDSINTDPANIHMMRAELGAKIAAEQYSCIIKQAIPFDVVLLGMGEDGHTASLFPGHRHTAGQIVHPVFGSPKPPLERVSLSVHALSQNMNLLMLITGASKQGALDSWREGEGPPIAQISSLGKGIVLMDNSLQL